MFLRPVFVSPEISTKRNVWMGGKVVVIQPEP